MKIAIVHGQSHCGTTCQMGRLFAEKLADKSDIEEFFLPRDLGGAYCVGCYRCIEDETKCHAWEMKSRILNALEKADLWIFTTPNYCMSASAPMKAFLDLTFDMWMVHRPKAWAFRKRAVVFSASAGASCKGAVGVIAKSLQYWGVPEIRSFALPVHAMNWEGVDGKTKDKIARKLDGLARGVTRRGDPKTGWKTKILFFIMRGLHAKGWDSSPKEGEYWKERGWLGKSRPWKDKERQS